jgi:hypothetical protein
MDVRAQQLIFLLGAGASVDAGMPTVAGLTRKLRECLPDVCGINGNPCPEFGQIFDIFAGWSPSLAENYERFFEWLQFIINAQKDPYRKFCEVKIDSALVEKIYPLAYMIGPEIAKLLESYAIISDYFALFGGFIPKSGRLKMFTLNYNCCLEDSCRKAGIDVTTGFDPNTKKWNLSQFKKHVRGINLYKLHGSLRWFGTRDLARSDGKIQNRYKLMELSREERGSLGPHLSITEDPELILGPGSKVQVDDPYLTLLYQFHLAFQQAKLCVVIGFSYGDEHIKTMLGEAFDAGLSILDVNRSDRISSLFFQKRKDTIS